MKYAILVVLLLLTACVESRMWCVEVDGRVDTIVAENAYINTDRDSSGGTVVVYDLVGPFQDLHRRAAFSYDSVGTVQECLIGQKEQ